MSLISVNGGYIDRERNAYVLRFRDPAGVLALYPRHSGCLAPPTTCWQYRSP